MKHKKWKKEPVCPGCSKHCPMASPRCKYGRAYFAKQTQKENIKQTKNTSNSPSRSSYKWEAYVTRGGPAWLMLLTLRNAKKALRKGRVTEAQLLRRLTDEDRLQLTALLQKLDCGDALHGMEHPSEQ